MKSRKKQSRLKALRIRGRHLTKEGFSFKSEKYFINFARAPCYTLLLWNVVAACRLQWSDWASERRRQQTRWQWRWHDNKWNVTAVMAAASLEKSDSQHFLSSSSSPLSQCVWPWLVELHRQSSPEVFKQIMELAEKLVGAGVCKS